MLHVAPGTIRPQETHLFQIIVFDFLAKPLFFPKTVLMAHGIVLRPFFFSTNDDENTIAVLSEKADSISAVAYSKLNRNQEDQMQRYEKGQSSQSQEPTAD